MKHGFRSPQGPIRMPESVKQYLESISVFEHRYPVNTAVWIATALLAAEVFDSNPTCSKTDMYFKQTCTKVGGKQCGKCSLFAVVLRG